MGSYGVYGRIVSAQRHYSCSVVDSRNFSQNRFCRLRGIKSVQNLNLLKTVPENFGDAMSALERSIRRA